MRISKEVKTGVVVILTLVGFYSLFNFLKGKNLFASGNTYYVKYDDVSGLAPSKPVSVNGLRVGRVDEIKIMDKQSPIYFVVKISLERDIDFSKNTVAEIYEPGLMSGPEIRLLLDYKGPKARNEDTLRPLVKPSLTSMFSKELEPTKRKIDSLLVSVNSTMMSVDKLLDEENRQSLKNVLRNLDATLVTFNGTAQSITRTSDNANSLIIDNKAQLKNTLASAEQAIAKFGTMADKINNLELEKIIKNFEEASVNLNTVLAKVNSGEGTLGAMMNDKQLYDNLIQTSKTLDALLLDLKENPNRYVQFSIFGKKQKPTEEK
ncbi:MlaD family protein [Moheibacter sediminis]|uniref:Phospholipid/cholesterol/gamma-HCH transport system substrate-binding protein n=1 Tax=Moheibacter sediminis TaxID=1434700 RepID=A0A1W1ZX00_9FLAO|nr:MlaD family protein [Moheibacter sediminis]SMC52876.1 phospholipid/cholesterol/gamma-HCH transport system substrate-binding protein [Moheibacter sediminis]